MYINQLQKNLNAATRIICCTLRSTTSKPGLCKRISCFHLNKCESVDVPALIKQWVTGNTGVIGHESAFLLLLLYFKLCWHSERHLKNNNNITTQNMCYLIMSTLKEGEHATHPDIRLSIHFLLLLWRITVAVGSPQMPFRSSWGSLRLWYTVFPRTTRL